MAGFITSLQLDILQQIVNVNWGITGFLYCGAGGMVGSNDGETWKKMPDGVEATSVAYAGGCWIAAGVGAYHRSTDAAKTWTSCASPGVSDESTTINTVVVGTDQLDADGKPKVDSDGKPLPGLFAVMGFTSGATSSSAFVKISNNNADSWSTAITIDTTTGPDKPIWDFAASLSAAGGRIFFGTGRSYSSQDAEGFNVTYSDAFLYVSDGGAFSGPTLIEAGGGNTSYQTGYVGYDTSAKKYCLTVQKSIKEGPLDLMYRISSTPSFGAGSDIFIASGALGNPGPVAGGGGSFATGFHDDDGSGSYSVSAAMLPGGPQSLTSIPYAQALGAPFQAVCYSGAKKDSTGGGKFCCSTIDGKIYAAKPAGSFKSVYSGSPLISSDGGASAYVAAGEVTLPK